MKESGLPRPLSSSLPETCYSPRLDRLGEINGRTPRIDLLPYPPGHRHHRLPRKRRDDIVKIGI